MITYKTYIYAIIAVISIFALSGINFDKFIRKNKVWETRILVILLALSISYLVTNFITDFINIGSLIK